MTAANYDGFLRRCVNLWMHWIWIRPQRKMSSSGFGRTHAAQIQHHFRFEGSWIQNRMEFSSYCWEEFYLSMNCWEFYSCFRRWYRWLEWKFFWGLQIQNLLEWASDSTASTRIWSWRFFWRWILYGRLQSRWETRLNRDGWGDENRAGTRGSKKIFLG